MTTAQKNAKAKFKQAIAYRQKTGVSLKDAFAHIYGKKVASVSKKTVKKSATKKVGALKLKPNEMRLGLLSNKVGATVKKKKAKKPSEQSILNKIHIVKKGVDKLDEAQHKHMIGEIKKSKDDILDQIKYANEKISRHEKGIRLLYPYRKHKELAKSILVSKKLIKELKTHISELKKHL